PGRAPTPEAPLRPEAHPGGPRGGSEGAGTVRARSPSDGHALAPEHSRDLRLWQDSGWGLLLRHGRTDLGVGRAVPQRRNVMNWDQIAGNWTQLKGKIKEKWGKLTDDDLTTIAGKRDQLAGKLRERYGYAKDQAERELDEFARDLKS